MPLHGRPKDDIDDIFAGAPKTAKNETRHKKEHTEDARSHLAASKKTKTRESDQTSSLSTIGRAATGKHSASKTSAAAATFRTEDDFTDLKGVKKRRKTTEDGFKIYDTSELRIDPDAGETDACPFDCTCCY